MGLTLRRIGWGPRCRAPGTLRGSGTSMTEETAVQPEQLTSPCLRAPTLHHSWNPAGGEEGTSVFTRRLSGMKRYSIQHGAENVLPILHSTALNSSNNPNTFPIQALQKSLLLTVIDTENVSLLVLSFWRICECLISTSRCISLNVFPPSSFTSQELHCWSEIIPERSLWLSACVSICGGVFSASSCFVPQMGSLHNGGLSLLGL